MRAVITGIPARNPGPYTGAGNNTWLVDGAVPTLIDAGTGVRAHIDAVADALGGRDLARVIVTHGHADHASGVTAIRSRWPNVEALKFPLDGESGWLTLVDGMSVRAGDGILVVIHTPGHAVDHVCLWEAAGRELYGGDMVVKGSSVVIPAGRGGNLADYLSSLRRLAALDPARIYPGHGPVIDNPGEVIQAHLAHRLERERQVLACLADGLLEIDDIVTRLYPALPKELERAARMTVEAHLEKLRTENRI